jgi:hypothetical protein
MSEMPASVQQSIDIVEDECFLNDFSPVEKTKSRKILWRVGNIIRDRIKASAAARCSADSAGDTGTLEKVTSIIERHVPHDEAVHMAGDIIDLISPEIGRLREKLSSALSGGLPHSSDCAVYNAPAYEPGPCDCGMLNEPQSLPLRGPDCACCEQRPRKDCTVPGCTMKDAGWALERSQAVCEDGQ